MALEMVQLSDLIFDFNLYPRHKISQYHVAQMVEALRAEQTLPPPVVDRGSMRVVDGFHRVSAHRQIDANGTIQADVRTYTSEQQLFLDAVRPNVNHGLSLQRVDRVRALAKLRDLGVSPEDRAGIMGMTVDRAEALLTTRLSGDPQPVSLKGSVTHLSGKQTTEKQRRSINHAGGLQQHYQIDQVINLIQGDLINTDSATIMDRLRQLQTVLNEFLEAVEVT